jgi:hypothetical protein
LGFLGFRPNGLFRVGLSIFLSKLTSTFHTQTEEEESLSNANAKEEVNSSWRVFSIKEFFFYKKEKRKR